jgi:hypothetical protein
MRATSATDRVEQLHGSDLSRGFVYDSPTYDLAAFNGLDRATHRAEPSIGFGWWF